METTMSNGVVESSSSPPPPPPRKVVANERVYVAVGSDVEESKSILSWALDNFGGDFRILHVHQPGQIDTYAGELSDWDIMELERQRMHRTLDAYIQICNQAKVRAEKRYLELRDIGKGIVELVEEHAVNKLVMGAAAARHFFEGMQELKSRKAIFVNEHAHPSCQIWFVCNNHLIKIREGDLNLVDLDVTASSLLACSTVASVQSNQNGHNQNSTIQRSYSSEDDGLVIVRYERGETSTSSSGSSSFPSSKNGHHFYSELEAANARNALDEMLRRQKAEKAAIEANCRVSVLENLYAEEERQRKELEEVLVQERERFEAIITRQQEELLDSMEQNTLLKSQVTFSDQIIKELNDRIELSDEIIKELKDRVYQVEELLENCNQERDVLQVELDNSRGLTEELLRNQVGQASSSNHQQFLPEFSFSDIQEATNCLHPSMEIEDRDYGTIYRGVLHHTQVVIKMLRSDGSGSRSDSQYHLELEVASKMRHPNLVTLIGICPEAWSLVYEYLPNGSLEDQLDCGDRETSPLTWQTRLRIATEICTALTFLHSNEPEGIIHGDLKAENVLLDANFVSKLCGYGISPALSHPHTSSNFPVGRRSDPSAEFPHLDPHFLSMGELSTNSDVYSFGIVLLRLLTGKLAINLPIIVKDAVERGNISDLLDPLARGWPLDLARELILLALRCCDVDWSNRPDLGSEVLGMLESMRVDSEISSSFRPVDHEEERQPLQSFICSISQDIMEEPLVAADGFSYDAESIREWIDTGHDTSPLTNLPLAHLDLVPNHALRSAIQEWQQMS